MHKDFKELTGKILVSVETNKEMDEITFITNENEKFIMYHYQDCCESVLIEDINGDLQDLIGTPILLAEEVVSEENPEGVTKIHKDSFTWTFYKLATIKGYVVIRWYGESNGYYSENVFFKQLT